MIFKTDDFNYAVSICFECSFPEFTRQQILAGADFLVGITNDTWWGKTIGIYNHARVFLTRAVENRTWAVRSTNSGLTFIVDPYGRIRNELEIYTPAILIGKVDEIDKMSFFTRYGDLFGLCSLLITISLVGILLVLWILRKILK